MVLKGFINCAKRLVNVAQWFVNEALSLANDSKGLTNVTLRFVNDTKGLANDARGFANKAIENRKNILVAFCLVGQTVLGLAFLQQVTFELSSSIT